MKSSAFKWAWFIWRDAVASWETKFPSTVKTWSDACKAGWELAKEEFKELREKAVKSAKRVIGIVREFILSSAQVGEVTANPSTAGEVTDGFTIECTKRDVYAGNGQRRQQRSAYIRPAMNEAVLSNQIKEYRNGD